MKKEESRKYREGLAHPITQWEMMMGAYSCLEKIGREPSTTTDEERDIMQTRIALEYGSVEDIMLVLREGLCIARLYGLLGAPGLDHADSDYASDLFEDYGVDPQRLLKSVVSGNYDRSAAMLAMHWMENLFGVAIDERNFIKAYTLAIANLSRGFASTKRSIIERAENKFVV